MIREAIDIVASGDSLSMEDASTVMREIIEGEATQGQMGALFTALNIKGETVDEIAGMAIVMRENALRVNVSGKIVDTVGTGGDGLNTFNISTSAAFVVAAAGLKVAKHGNRAASSSCGSADVLEALGVKFDLHPEGVEQCINEVGFGFMFAPAFHASTRHAVPVRREIGIRTVFNILGPLTNPAGAQYLLVGVAYPELGQRMAEVFQALGAKHAIIVHGDGGLDEITLSGDTSVWELAGGKVSTWTLTLADTGMPKRDIEEIRGGSKEENAATMRRIFQGEQGPVRDYVVINSAATLLAAETVTSLSEGVVLAQQVIDSGAAMSKLEDLAELSTRLGQA
ncbi:MAG TPA: anthranilate phosphoribosyltransferase [Dehalococcoidia bacterium]|nr:anthranilate phosphoribosyltransferase [Dehalococcoidia bacterium]